MKKRHWSSGGMGMRFIFKPVRHQFREGEFASQDFFDHQGTLLIGKGQEVTSSLASLLNQKNVYNLTCDWQEGHHFPDRHSLSPILNRYHYIMPWLQRVYLDTELLYPQLLLESARFIHQMMENLAHHPAISSDFQQLCAYDSSTYMHSVNVALLSYAIGKTFGYDEESLYLLALGALLHDIGKLGIPLEIINKPETLSEEEFKIIQTHPQRGSERTSQILLEKNVLATILQHHERWNGSGYPHARQGSEIHPFAQIVAVADVFDALISDRPYRSGLPPYHAIEVILKGSGTLFAPDVVQTFMRTIQLYPDNSFVTLNSGETGIVLTYSLPYPTRPLVKILFDASGKPIENERIIDLIKDSSHYIHTVQYGRVS